jgi:hypothetical protein
MRTRMPRPIPTPPLTGEATPSRPARIPLVVGIVAWLVLAATAIVRGDGMIAATCAFLLVALVLGPRLAARKPLAWLALVACGAGLGLLAGQGHGLLALEALPVAISLGIAWLFGHTLGTAHPLIARVIVVLEGEERLALPGVADYARQLTRAWALLMLAQAIMFAVLIAARHGFLAWPPAAFAETWLLFGGWCVPLAFMAGEIAFRRWWLPHVPHDPPRVFLQRLATNWPRLLRDTVG